MENKEKTSAKETPEEKVTATETCQENVSENETPEAKTSNGEVTKKDIKPLRCSPPGGEPGVHRHHCLRFVETGGRVYRIHSQRNLQRRSN